MRRPPRAVPGPGPAMVTIVILLAVMATAAATIEEKRVINNQGEEAEEPGHAPAKLSYF